MQIEYLPKEAIAVAPLELRKHKPKQIARLMASIRTFGPNTPIIVDQDGQIIDGHGIFAAMVDLGFVRFPVIRLIHLNSEQQRLYRIAVNKLSEMTSWDDVILNTELRDLQASMFSLEIDPETLGFELADFELRLDTDLENEAEAEIEVASAAIAPLGDCWLLGQHRLLCGAL